MPKFTNEDKVNIEKKLEYIGLDLYDIPEFLTEFDPLEYRQTRGYDENTYKVYKYVSIKDIQIMITHNNRLDYIEKKYSSASPIMPYLDPKKEEDIIKHTIFLNMLKTVNIDDIETIEENQKKLNNQIPFKVKYHENYLWQIYYSENTDKYFMLLPTEDLEYAQFFYLLKKQIECNKKNIDEKIFVPICHLDYSGSYLRRIELTDIENYLWLFTKDWPLAYEVYDRDNNLSIQIVGETFCYEKMKSFYKVVLNSSEEAKKFLKHIKAMFILQTELPENYKFEAKIDENGGLEFYLKSKKIQYEDLAKLIEDEIECISNKVDVVEKENRKNSKNLELLKIKSNDKDKEYLSKEKQIAIYLECKKSFLGKVKYYFKNRKNNKTKLKAVNNKIRDKKEEYKNKEDIDANIEEVNNIKDIKNRIFKNKQYHTIEDLVDATKFYDKINDENKNIKLDIKAIEDKIKIMETKIKNANIYLEEIDENNKSIFDFWKFTNKDNALALNEGKENNKENKNKRIEKTFNYEEDLEDLAIQVDINQRKKLSKDECDSIYVATTENLKLINMLKKYNNINEITKDDQNEIIKSLERLQKEAEEETVFFLKEDFDIFGGIAQDRTKIKLLSGKTHREVEKSKFKILDITRNTKIEDYKERLNEISEKLKEASNKLKTPVNISGYIIQDGELEKDNFHILHIDPKKALEEKRNSKHNNMYRINLKTNMEVLLCTNIIYYDNYNKTLPLGMSLSDEFIIDLEKYDMKPIKENAFRINNNLNEEYVTEKINVIEYDLISKEN